MATDCALCKKRAANKMNSHIIPFFLIKSMVTPGESKRTEKDISYDLSGPVFAKTYFGRDVSPEKIESMLGRNMTEEDIEENANSFTVDNLLCTVCEDRFARIESIFARDIFPTIETNSKKLGLKHYTFSSLDSAKGKLLLVSIIWRISATEPGGFRMSVGVKEALRKLLDTALAGSEVETIENIASMEDEINTFKISLAFYDTVTNSAKGLFYFNPINSNPYIFHINGLTICYYLKGKTSMREGNSGHGLERIFKRKELFPSNNLIQFEHLEDDIQSSHSSVLTALTKKYLDRHSWIFKETCKKLVGVEPRELLVKQYMNELISGQCGDAERYSINRCAHLASKYAAMIRI